MKKRFTYIDPATNRIVYDAVHEPYVTREDVDKIVAQRVGKHWSSILNSYRVMIRTVDDNFVIPRKPKQKKHFKPRNYKKRRTNYNRGKKRDVEVRVKRKVETE